MNSKKYINKSATVINESMVLEAKINNYQLNINLNSDDLIDRRFTSWAWLIEECDEEFENNKLGNGK